MKALITDRFLPQMASKIQLELNCEVSYSKTETPTEDELKDVQILLIRSKTKITQKLLDRAPQLKVIISTTVGFDHIHYRLCQSRNIKVMHTPSAHTQAVAELTLLFILELHRKSFLFMDEVKKHKWRNHLPLSEELIDKSLGLVGLGRVGQSVAQKAQAFGLQVQAYDPYVEDSVFTKASTQRIGLTELFRTSDIISLHTPLTKETFHMINHRTLEEFSSEAMLINTARGDLICEDSLVKALDHKKIKQVALDVFAKEPLPKDSRLKAKSQVMITPHMGAYTQRAFQLSNTEGFQKLKNYLNSEIVSDSVPPNTQWARHLIEPL